MQMKIKDNRNTTTTAFGDLAIGEAYCDELDLLCIKTGADSCIYYDDSVEAWIAERENCSAYVYPVQATLVFE